MLAPKIHPIKEKCWECKQSQFSQVPKCPLRMLAIGPSGSGKSVALQNMVLDIYRNCFSRVYIFSPSIHIDSIWDPVKDYIKKELKPSKDEKTYSIITILKIYRRSSINSIRSLNI